MIEIAMIIWNRTKSWSKKIGQIKFCLTMIMIIRESHLQLTILFKKEREAQYNTKNNRILFSMTHFKMILDSLLQ